MTRTSWSDLAKREHFAAVVPDGLDLRWNDLRQSAGSDGARHPIADDVEFLTALIDKLVKSGIADRQRVYIAGVSNGGAMAMTMVCERARLFAAAASVIINFNDSMAAVCKPMEPVSVLIMNGTSDPLIPYGGGKGRSWFSEDGYLSTERTVEFWRHSGSTNRRMSHGQAMRSTFGRARVTQMIRPWQSRRGRFFVDTQGSPAFCCALPAAV